jgi:quercetin dioxygenase-like cupin family protein
MNGEEKERVRTRERGAMDSGGYEKSLKWRADFQQRQLTGRIVIRGQDVVLNEAGRQGTSKRYLHYRDFEDTALQDWIVFIHHIRTHSGMHRHQGGLIIFVLEGEGATEVDGEKVPWKAGDLILLPIKPKGVEHKHYNNDPGKGCRWMAFIYVPIWDHVASEMVQLELHPEFAKTVVDQKAYIQAQAENTAGTNFFRDRAPEAVYGERLGGAKPLSTGGNGHTLMDELFLLRNRQREIRRTARWLVSGEKLKWENNAQGIMRWYMHPSIEDIVIQSYLFYVQEIPPGSRSGKQLHQGNQLVHILEGKGYTIMDGVKHPWEAGDLVQLPLRRDGVIFQHFNDSATKRVRFAACEPNLVHATGVDRGSGFEQLEASPDFGRSYTPER